MTPQPGDYACRTMGGTPGKLISLGEFLNGDGFSEYDHAEIYVGMPDSHAGWGYTMGAYPGGARLYPVTDPANLSDGNGWLWSSGKIPLTPFQRQSVVNYALACQGIPYGWLDYLALAAHRFHLPVPGLRSYIGSTRSMICSQMVSWVYAQAGIQLFPGLWPGYVTPAMLAGVIREHSA